jgi:hypothetical protein
MIELASLDRAALENVTFMKTYLHCELSLILPEKA